MVQMYCTVGGHGLSCQREARITTWPAAVFRLGLGGFMFLLVVTGWLPSVWAAPVNLAWDATTKYTDGTSVTTPVVYHLYIQDNAGGAPQRVDVDQTTYTLTDCPATDTPPDCTVTVTYTLTGLTEGQLYTITATATAMDLSEESLPSNALMVLVPITQPEPAPEPVSTPAGTPVSIPVLPPATAPTDAPPTITEVTQGAHGEVTITGTDVTYTPEASFVGTDSFTYTTTDGQGVATTTTVTVTVLPGTQPSLAGAGTASPPSGTSGTMSQPASPGQPADYSVLVGYADLTHAVPANFPTPWEGSPGVIFKGCPSCPILDTGAVRIMNNMGGTLTVNAVIVRLGTCTFNLWPSNISLPLGGELIVTQTASGGDGGCLVHGRSDTLEVGAHGADGTGVCTNSNIIPQVDVTVNGVTTTYADTGQILNTGGIDVETCANGTNASTQWTSIGSPPCPRAVLTVTPSTQSQEVGTTATVSATFTNSCGTPLAGVNVDFTSLTGPNVGTIHMDTTDRSGGASFSYTSASRGTDTLQAAVTNLAGTITSPNVSVTWANPTSASVASAPRGGGGGGGGGGGDGGGCSLQPGGAASPAAYLAAAGNMLLPVVLLLVLRVRSWRRQR
jgi:Big-like domain-containing protein